MTSSSSEIECQHEELRNIISSFAWISQFTALAVSDCQVRGCQPVAPLGSLAHYLIACVLEVYGSNTASALVLWFV